MSPVYDGSDLWPFTFDLSMYCRCSLTKERILVVSYRNVTGESMNAQVVKSKVLP